jgi:hypothetical protein
MGIPHIYATVESTVCQPDSLRITLTGGAVIKLPATLRNNVGLILSGDNLLGDFALWSEGGYAHFYVLCDGNLATHFVARQDECVLEGMFL